MFSTKKEEKNNTSKTAKTSSLTNFIAKGTVITGDVQAQGSLRLEGRIEGNIQAHARLVMAPNSELKGDIRAKNAEISGKVDGNLHVSEILTLKAEAVITGHIHTYRLVLEEGARFDGECKMRSSKDDSGREQEKGSSVSFRKETASSASSQKHQLPV